MPDEPTNETTAVSQPTNTSLAIIDSSPPGIREMLSAVINVAASGIYHEPSCAFCSSRHRAEAERMVSNFDIGVRDPEVRVSQFFNTVGESVSVDVVRNHVAVHMNRGDLELRKAEYVAKLATMAGGQFTSMSQTKLASAAILECITSSGTIVPTKGLSPAKAMEIKASVISKLVKTFIDVMVLQAKLSGEMWNEGKMIAIPADDFHRVFDRALNDAQTTDERRLIRDVLDGLTNAIQK